MRKISIIIIALILSISSVFSDEWTAFVKKDIISSSSKYVFKLTPEKEYWKKPGHCKGELFKINNNGDTLIWKRNLINNIGPVNGIVTNSGQYVITFDEWHNVGKLPIVIYGKKGELIKCLDIKILGLENNRNIKQSASSYWWNENSIIFLDNTEEKLFIRLHWGDLLIIELKNGNLMNNEWFERHKKWYIKETDWNELHKYAEIKIKEKVIELLKSDDSNNKKTGILVAGQIKLQEAIPYLKQLLTNEEYYTYREGNNSSKILFFLRKEAKIALEKMNIKVEDIIIELDEKNHLKFDEQTGKYKVKY